MRRQREWIVYQERFENLRGRRWKGGYESFVTEYGRERDGQKDERKGR